MFMEESDNEAGGLFYITHPLPKYPNYDPFIIPQKQDIPHDILIWKKSQIPRLKNTATKALPDALPFSLRLPVSFNDLDPAQLKIVAQGVVLHVLEADLVSWRYHKRIVEDKKHLYSLRKKFFKIFAKFALHIFDLEDFVREVEKPMIINNAREFCHHLEEKFGDNPEEVASRATTDLSFGKMDLKKFPFLWQQDVDIILGCYHRKNYGMCDTMAQQVGVTYVLNSSKIEKFNVYEHYVTAVLEAMKEHVPLEEGKKMDLMMNAGRKRCVPRQALYLEAWRGFEEDDLRACGPGYEELFIISFHNTLNNLVRMKAELVSYSERVNRSPMECGTLGNFSEEVLEAVRIANFERMRHGCRFLNTGHLLFGLSSSRIANKIKLFEQKWVPIPVVKELEDTVPAAYYYILRLSHDVATSSGLGEVLLEHLYLATIYASRLLPTKRIKSIDSSEPLIDWKPILEQGVIIDFLKQQQQQQSLADDEMLQSSGELPEKLLWGQFFPEQDGMMPFTLIHMLTFLDQEFRKNNFNPLQSCRSSTKDLIRDDDTSGDNEIGVSRLVDEYCDLYCQHLYTLYDGY